MPFQEPDCSASSPRRPPRRIAPQGEEKDRKNEDEKTEREGIEIELEAKGGGRKLALQNGKVEGSKVGKNTALFLEAVKEAVKAVI